MGFYWHPGFEDGQGDQDLERYTTGAFIYYPWQQRIIASQSYHARNGTDSASSGNKHIKLYLGVYHCVDAVAAGAGNRNGK